MDNRHLTLNISGHLLELNPPKVMGIINVTTDSFYSGSRVTEKDEIRRRAEKMIAEGADILDVGACSTRPGSNHADGAPDDEAFRLSMALEIIRKIDEDIPVSVDTYVASVARKMVRDWDANIINDVSGGEDPEMFETVAELKVPYVLTHSRGRQGDTMSEAVYDDVTAEVITELSKKVYKLRDLKVNDVIIDPGFGFAKTTEQNFTLLQELQEFKRMGMPLLVGVSRKSMIWKTLDCCPDDTLEGTIALNAIALEKGADILRVHDVKAAKDLVRLMEALKGKDNG